MVLTKKYLRNHIQVSFKQVHDPDKVLAEVLNGLKIACQSSVFYQTMSDAVNINDILKKYEPQSMYIWTMVIWNQMYVNQYLLITPILYN